MSRPEAPFVSAEVRRIESHNLPALLFINGAPRSGTTWTVALFNSHPAARFRYQPLFSYAFKGIIGVGTGRAEILDYLQRVAATEDDFVLQRGKAQLGDRPPEPDRAPCRLLAIKETHYHHLLPNLIRQLQEARFLFVVRDPRAVINSFLTTPSEFKPGWNPHDEWRRAPAKNQGRPENFFGFEKWIELTRAFMSMARSDPQRCRLVQYERLIADPTAQAAELFAFAGLELAPATLDFIAASAAGGNRRHDHGLIKDRSVATRWQSELAPEIRSAIETELRGTDLERFLVAAEAGNPDFGSSKS